MRKRAGVVAVLGGLLLVLATWNINSTVSQSHDAEMIHLRASMLNDAHEKINQRSVHFSAHQKVDKAKVVDDGGAPIKWYEQCNADWQEQVHDAPSSMQHCRS